MTLILAYRKFLQSMRQKLREKSISFWNDLRIRSVGYASREYKLWLSISNVKKYKFNPGTIMCQSPMDSRSALNNSSVPKALVLLLFFTGNPISFHTVCSGSSLSLFISLR